MTAPLPLDQIAQAFGKDERGGPQLDDFDLAPRDQQIKRTAADTGKPAGIWNAHTDWLDSQRRRRRRGRGQGRHRDTDGWGQRWRDGREREGQPLRRVRLSKIAPSFST